MLSCDCAFVRSGEKSGDGDDGDRDDEPKEVTIALEDMEKADKAPPSPVANGSAAPEGKSGRAVEDESAAAADGEEDADVGGNSRKWSREDTILLAKVVDPNPTHSRSCQMCCLPAFVA